MAAAEPPIFFIHVMKTGGVTLLESIRARYAAGEVYPDAELDLTHLAPDRVAFRHLTLQYLDAIPSSRRDRIRVYAGHFPQVACDVLGGRFRTVTILRDPVERTISLLRQFQRAIPWMVAADAAPHAPLALEEIYEQPHIFEPLVHNHQTKLFSMTLADHPTGYMQEIAVDDTRLAAAKANLDTVEVVGLTERYAEFLTLVDAHFGWQVPKDVRINVSPPDDPLPVEHPLRARIAEDNAIDLAFYAHAKALVDSRARLTAG